MIEMTVEEVMTYTGNIPVDTSRDLIAKLCEQRGFEYVAQIVMDEWRKRDWSLGEELI